MHSVQGALDGGVKIGRPVTAHATFKFSRQLRLSRLIGLPCLLPCGMAFSACHRGIPTGTNGIRNLKRPMWPAQPLAGGGNLGRPQRRAMAVCSARFGRRTIANGGLATNQCWLIAIGFGRRQRLADGVRIVAVHGVDHVPAIGPKARRRVIGKPATDVAIDGDAVVVVTHHQLAQAQCAGQRTDLVRNAFHQTAVASEHPGHVVDHGVLGRIEARRQQFLRQGHADRIGQTLPQWPCGGLNAGRLTKLRVAGGR